MESFSQLFGNILAAVVSVIGAVVAVITMVQGRRQSRQDDINLKKDEAYRKQEYALYERQVMGTEQGNEHLRGLLSQIKETNDPAKREELQALINAQVETSKIITPDILTAQLSALQTTLHAEIQEFSQRIDSRINTFITPAQLLEQQLIVNRMLQRTETLNQEAAALKEDIDRQAKEGFNIDQLQRQLLINIGTELIELANKVAPPTQRRYPSTESHTSEMHGDG